MTNDYKGEVCISHFSMRSICNFANVSDVSSHRFTPNKCAGQRDERGHGRLKKELIATFGSGLIVSFSLNFWDRALYLSVINERRFLDFRNFRRPFHGVTQSLCQRAISHGLYFPLEHIFHSAFSDSMHFGHNTSSILGGTYLYLRLKSVKICNISTLGTCAGTVNALILNPISAIKYTVWTKDRKTSWINQVSTMHRKGGFHQFTKGVYATMARDITFGAIFSLLRRSGRQRYMDNTHNDNTKVTIPYSANLLIDGSSAFVATVCSSPFNYVRNMQYEKATKSIPPMIAILRDLYHTGLCKGRPSDAMKWWMFRLRIGWGTARVAVGMSFTSFCYEMSQYIID